MSKEEISDFIKQKKLEEEAFFRKLDERYNETTKSIDHCKLIRKDVLNKYIINKDNEESNEFKDEDVITIIDSLNSTIESLVEEKHAIAVMKELVEDIEMEV